MWLAERPARKSHAATGPARTRGRPDVTPPSWWHWAGTALCLLGGDEAGRDPSRSTIRERTRHPQLSPSCPPAVATSSLPPHLSLVCAFFPQIRQPPSHCFSTSGVERGRRRGGQVRARPPYCLPPAPLEKSFLEPWHCCGHRAWKEPPTLGSGAPAPFSYFTSAL